MSKVKCMGKRTDHHACILNQMPWMRCVWGVTEAKGTKRERGGSQWLHHLVTTPSRLTYPSYSLAHRTSYNADYSAPLLGHEHLRSPNRNEDLVRGLGNFIIYRVCPGL